MNNAHINTIAQELSISSSQIKSVAELLESGATVPFISRYRKEQTGSLDEVVIGNIRDRLSELEQLDARREAILKSMRDQDVLTTELEEALLKACSLTTLEDIYLPYKPKRRTRAMIARERGLEPLADIMQAQELDPANVAADYINPEKEVNTIEDALSGARDIIAERISEDSKIRNTARLLFAKEAVLKSEVYTGLEDEASTYRDYFDWSEKASKAPSHRILAILRGNKEVFLKLSIKPDDEQAISLLSHRAGARSEQMKLAAQDSYKRLLGPSMETELRNALKERAEDEAINVFATNLRELLMAPPLGQRNVLAIDPGFRTGCKVVCLDRQGALKHHSVIYPTQSERKINEAEAEIRKLIKTYEIETIAIGNGTASRETETFINALKLNIPTIMVNESGASIYSASAVAREEFPDHDVTVRGAISIGRRLMDPLAELVKIDPKSIGVGQYQHDVDQAKLKTRLDDVVMSCVNGVGVEVNTASKELLTYVSGLGPALAANIVTYRNENGPFQSRTELKKVPRLGAKAFEQAAGFLRISGAKNPLDASAVHPERYKLVQEMAADLSCSVADLIKSEELRAQIQLKRYVSDEVGLPTLRDIQAELNKPGRDPREKFEIFSFAEGVSEIKDLHEGMQLPGIVTNVTNFGAFVDIGVHQDGLVHISQLADRFVKDPNDVVKVNQKVKVRVLEVDAKRKRISLSMKKG